jgi:microsomal dipeptidase-like Zn-dependent dipeptidase
MGDLVEELERAGFGPEEIVGILGENYLRLAA